MNIQKVTADCRLSSKIDHKACDIPDLSGCTAFGKTPAIALK